MEEYVSEPYFRLLLYSLFGYILVWLVSFIAARLIRSGNPYKGIVWTWFFVLATHTILVICFGAYTVRDMSGTGREDLDIFYYNIGFIVLFVINLLLLLGVWNSARRIRY